MAKATKTWKLGEVAQGGVITAEIIGTSLIPNGKIITIIGKEWDFSTGSRKSSNQSNAKEFTRGSVLANEQDAERKLYMFLSDLSTSYWADEIIKWIKTKVKIEPLFGY
jgi:hypothetical protein